jgi:hypothetical protein
MSARFLSVSLSTVAVLVACADALAQRTAPPMGGAGGNYGTAPARQGGYEPVPGSAEDKRTAQEILQQTPKLAENVSKLFPAGTDLPAAATGFRSLSDFVAAAYVGKNLGIPFADMKAKMLGGASLDRAISALKPDADGLIEARKARGQADELIGG